MSYLKAKSEFNLDAAQILIDESYYAPSIHCSYYGCFQYIKHKLNKIGITYEKMDAEISASKELSSNKYPLDLVKKEVRKVDQTTYRELNNKIKLLKNARIESDYHNVEIKSKKGEEALALSKEIIKLIDSKL